MLRPPPISTLTDTLFPYPTLCRSTLFVGYGVDGGGKVNADVKGKLAIMLFDNAPFGDKLPRYRERRQMLADAGASAVPVISTGAVPRSEERRVGKEGGSTGRSRGWPDH